MHRLRYLLILVCGTLIVSAAPSTSACVADEAAPLRLLFAGSSSTYWNDLPREVAKIVDRRVHQHPGRKVAVEIVGRSGSDIRVYSEPGFKNYEYGVKPNQTFLEKVRDERFDLVSLMVVCRFILGDDDPTGTGQSHADAVTKYCEAIRVAGGEPIFYEMGWGKSEREAEGRRRIFELAVKNRIRIFAPCSSAWARVYVERPDLALQHPQDGAHPGDLGHFLNLACFYAALTRASPVGVLPRSYHVWPHGLPKPTNEQQRAAIDQIVSQFKPDAYQAKLPKWMYRNMAESRNATIDEPTARYLETVAWETWQAIDRRLIDAVAAAEPVPAPDAQSTSANSAKPNILFVLTDDQGQQTLGCYGGKRVATPHLDSLARDGMLFRDAYVMPQCTPTRAALLSGQHSARNGMWHVIPWYGSPWARVAEPAYREQFPRTAFSLPKGLRSAGYATGMGGKWHLTSGNDGDYVALKPDAGSAYGFDFVAPPGSGSQNEGDKWVDHLTDQAIDFIERHRDRPWFFYLAHHTLHGTVSAPQPLVQKYLAAGAPPTGMHNAVYLAAIEHLDNSIGRLHTALEEMKLRENTIVVFLSDNGGVDTSYLLPGWTGEPTDGSRPLKIKTQEFDNAPLRSGKGSPYEGGIRVPCLVRWPAKVRAGAVSETPIHVVDWLPTLLAAAGAQLPRDHVVDGVSLLPLMQGGEIAARSLFWYLPLYDLRWAATPCGVMRDGDWKLIDYFGDSFDSAGRYRPGSRVELFHLRNDAGEQNDLADRETARAAAMQQQLRGWIKSIPATVPQENPHHDPARAFEETKQKQPWNAAG